MKGVRLVLCDTEEEYAQHMTEFLQAHKEIPWEVYAYTDIGDFKKSLQRKETEFPFVLIAENAYTEEVRALTVNYPQEKRILLNESGRVCFPEIRNINKYQEAENVYKEILGVYVEEVQKALPRLSRGSHTRLIGMYSPVKRCLQTTFALTLGQIMAQSKRTLYLNFEHYAGITELLPEVQTRDLTDLIFFLNTDQEKFLLRMQTILQKKGEMDYIPPVRAGSNLLEVSAGEWLDMLKRIGESGEYEYVILDLSDNLHGLFEILKMCSCIYTIGGEDPMAKYKMQQYEQLMNACEYGDILEKTICCRLPKFKSIPCNLEQLTKSELADYIRKNVKEICG